MKTSLFLLIIILLQFTIDAQDYYPNKYKNNNQTITSIIVASVAFVPVKWEKELNWHSIELLVREAATNGGAKVVVTPEGALDGYVINEVNKINDTNEKDILVKRFIKLAEPLEGTYIQKASELADELDIFLVLGFLELRNEVLYNTAILIDPEGDIIGRYSKTHFAQGYTINPDVYTAGNEYPIFDTPFGKVGIIICYDRQLPEPARIMAIKGAQILFVPAYGSYTDESGWNTVLMRTRAYENRLPVIFCNPYQSLLIDHRGNIQAIGGANEIIYYNVDTSPERYVGRFSNRRPFTYYDLMKQ